MSEVLKYYADECPNCDSWDVRIKSEKFIDDENSWDIIVYCRDCGFEWDDYVEGEE
jgi:hypothetical protein